MTIFREERGLTDPATNDRGRARPPGGRVDFVPLGKYGMDARALMYVVPREPIVLDEMRITPSRRWGDAQAVGQAKQALAQAKAGRRIAEGDIERMQQRLMSAQRNAELAGRESEGRQLAESLGDVRRSQLTGQALNLLADAKKGRPIADRAVEKLQQRLVGMERQAQLSGQESEGMQLAVALGEVRRSQLVREARDVLAGAAQGRRLSGARVNGLQQRLLMMERQDEYFGRESEGKQLATALGDVRRSQLIREARNVLARARDGQRFSDAHVKKLQQLLGGLERQDELLGRDSEGLQLAAALAELRR